jgi:hypothetical protein
MPLLRSFLPYFPPSGGLATVREEELTPPLYPFILSNVSGRKTGPNEESPQSVISRLGCLETTVADIEEALQKQGIFTVAPIPENG